MVTLKDGTQVEDSRLDRLVQFDEASRGYPIRAVVGDKPPRSYTWRITHPEVINQGQEGACVGFAVTNELMARPAEARFTNPTSFARNNIYHEAQRIDPWAGGAYPGASPFYEGTSILAGVKVAQRLGYFGEYRWAFGLRDLVLGLGYNGPAVLGLAWYESMYEPDEDGFIRPSGHIVGGHAILASRVKVVFNGGKAWEFVDHEASFIELHNSWGENYGLGGKVRVNFTQTDFWLRQAGEAVFFLNRTARV